MPDPETSPVISAERPNRLAVTMGCPAGIGPEIILHYLVRRKLPQNCVPVVIGDVGVLKRCARELRISVEIITWQPGKRVDPEKVQVFEPRYDRDYRLNPDDLIWGVPGRDTGYAAVAYIREAVRLITDGVVDGMVTCPIAKHAIRLAGSPFPGHTEMLASLCRTANFGMMMAGERLKVALVTIHTPLARVSSLLHPDEIKRVIRLTGETLIRDFAVAKPRIAVAGFNPHGGEAGLFGREEEEIIAPAVAASLSEKWELTGPLPPDTVFRLALDGRYDAVVAMYHDQGLIPFKLVHFDDGVNLTMGLPIIRTSVDHGTAYDIAGKGVAKDSSLEAAFFTAARIIDNRKRLQ